MKMFLMPLLLFLILSSTAFADCSVEAEKIVVAAVKLFNVNDTGFHCRALGRLEKLQSLPVLTVMPPRYAYQADFHFPCGPQPKKPVVTVLLNSECKIVRLDMTGHKLE